MSYNRRCQQQRQQHGGTQQRQQQLESYYDYHYRLHQQKQQQLQYYYDYHYLHQQHRASMAMTRSFDSSSSGVNKQARAATETNHQPSLLHGFHGVPSTAATSGLMGRAPNNNLLPSTMSGCSELTTFRESGSGTCWDELGRIMEI
jgi:hypothetical protein